MLDDRHPEVRYNAATGLARHGDVKCIAVLREMLDPQQADSRRTTIRREMTQKAMIQKNALQATAKLAAANPAANLDELAEAVERLARAEAGGEAGAEVGLKAAEVLHWLQRRHRTSDGSRP